MKYYWFLKFLNFKEGLHKILSNYFQINLEVSKNNYKFPPLDEKDIHAKISRLQNILKLNKELECKILSQRTILIKPK